MHRLKRKKVQKNAVGIKAKSKKARQRSKAPPYWYEGK